jgi:hypothetical protein
MTKETTINSPLVRYQSKDWKQNKLKKKKKEQENQRA